MAGGYWPNRGLTCQPLSFPPFQTTKLQRTASNACEIPYATKHLQAMASVRNRVRPNPSVEARPNGKAARRPPGYAYHPSGRRATSPSAPPHLER